MARKSVAPWSERVAEGLIDQPIDSTITASQTLRATVDTGFIDQTGTWKGIVSSDAAFSSIQTSPGIANTANFLTPSQNADGTWPLDMTGYGQINIAIKPTNGGNVSITAIMGPDAISFGGLSPVDSGTNLKGNRGSTGNELDNLFVQSAVSLTVDVWNIFMLDHNILANQKLLQFKIVNNSGGSSDYETAFMRLL